MRTLPLRPSFVGAAAFAILPALAAGQPVGAEFQVNTYTTGDQDTLASRALAADASGNFVVVWASDGQDGSEDGVFGQRYDSNGVALGEEFQVNSYTTDRQVQPSVASDPSGNFVVVWEGYRREV